MNESVHFHMKGLESNPKQQKYMSDTNDVNVFIKKVDSTDLNEQNTRDLKAEWATLKAGLPVGEQASAETKVQKSFSA